MKLPAYMAAVICVVGLGSGCMAMAQSGSPPKTSPAGEEKQGDTKMLEAGAKLLQSNSPLKGFDVYLDGFHPMKDKPEMQMEAHHFCHQMNDDFAQCVLFDGNTRQSLKPSATLLPVECCDAKNLYPSDDPRARGRDDHAG